MNRIDPLLGETWQRVSPKYVVVDLIGVLVSLVLLGGASLTPFVLTGSPWFLLITAAVVVVHVVAAALTPRRVRAIGYRLRQDDLVFRRGIMFFRMTAVPYGRMQLVDISRGPIARAFGLSELKLVTAAASTNVTIPGLTESDAEELRERLVELAESRRAGL